MSYIDMKSALETVRAFRYPFTKQISCSSVTNRGSQVIAFLLLALSVLSGAAYAQADTSATSGGIHGKVLVTRKLTGQRMRFRLYPGFKPLPPPNAEEKRDDEWQNIVIYLESTPSMSAVPAVSQDPEILQLGETFIPHVLPIVKGSTVEFPNQDPIFHNVFSLSRTKSFDLGRYPSGSSRSVTFEQTGIVPVFCHLHSDMSAIVMVLDNPYFSVPGTDGRYRIDDIPAGKYTLIAWHERSERVGQQVEVMPGQVLELNITVPIEDEETSVP